nr:SRPBCC family protein [Streptomyces sp. SID5468]
MPADPAAVYAVLADVEHYPAWWPQVREVRRIDETSGTLRIRSLLPYDLTVTLRQDRRDPVAGVLRARLSGDMDGVATWRLTADRDGTLVRFEQHVVVAKPLLRRLAVPGRPFFRANHALMMRAGRRGLRAALAPAAPAV